MEFIIFLAFIGTLSGIALIWGLNEMKKSPNNHKTAE